MTSNKPYLIRALHEWISDNSCTPYLYVNTQVEGVKLPAHLQAENPLVLNISSNACKSLALGDSSITFLARFGGQVSDILIPTNAVLAIVARENGQGMTFEWEESSNLPSEESEQTTMTENSEATTRKSGLKIVR